MSDGLTFPDVHPLTSMPDGEGVHPWRREPHGFSRALDYHPFVPTHEVDSNLIARRDKIARFLPVAQAVAAMSKDPSSKVGAVILGPDFEIRSTGWNGAPRGCKADVDDRVLDRAQKLLWTSHAEANAIAQAARTGTPLKGCTILVTHLPCSSCAKLIVQAGITTVAAPAPEPAFAERWADDFAVTRAMFIECGITLMELPG